MNNLGNITASIVSIFRRFHMVLFIVTVTAGLATGILLLNFIVLKTNNSTPSSKNTTKSSFDQDTIMQIKQLKTSDEPSVPLDFSKGRISPFNE